MRVVVAHNYYQHPGGEDKVFAAESELLLARGHDVTTHTVSNRSLVGGFPLAVARNAIWNTNEYRELVQLFGAVHPDIVHVHNTLPIISPAIYYAARSEGARVVQTLHNYRQVCPAGTLYRRGSPCEVCVGKSIPWPGVLNACYRGDLAASATVASVLTYHRFRRTYRNLIDRYIALTEFSKQKFIDGGLPSEKLVVKPNFLSKDPGPGTGEGENALFVGRLSAEKGVSVMLAAWSYVGSQLPLRIAGDGPLAGEVAAAHGSNAITWLGPLSASRVEAEMKRAAVLVVPSTWYEGLPMAVVEAFAVGTPILASSLGGLTELVEHGVTGILFRPGDAEDLARSARWVGSNLRQVNAMRRAARACYHAKYTASVNYAALMEIYDQALGEP